MTSSEKVTIVSADDWEGLYVDGVLEMENHTLDLLQVLAKLGVNYDCIEADEEWLAERARLPGKLSDVRSSDG